MTRPSPIHYDQTGVAVECDGVEVARYRDARQPIETHIKH